MEQESAYLDLTILSAADLKRKWLSGDQTVAVVWVDPLTKKTTSVVSGNGSNVQWHEKLILTLNGVDTFKQGKLLTIEIHARGMWGDSLLGSVYVPLIDLNLDGEKRGNTTLMYQIVQPSGKRQGSVKFFAKVVKPRVSGSVVPLPFAPPIILLEDNHTGLGFNAFYPPSSMCSVETNDERCSSIAYSPYPTLEVPPYPPQPRLSQNCATDHNAWQHDPSPYPSYQMGSHPPHVYPPVNATYPPDASQTLYPPPVSVYPPSTGTPYPPVAPHPPYPPIASETYPATSLYPYSNFSSPLYPPIASETYPATSSYPYSNFSSPLYPPPYYQQQAAGHYP